MALKYDGDKVTRVGGVGNGGGDDVVTMIFKALLGKEPSQWLRFFLAGVAIMWAIDHVLDEASATRKTLTEYIAANEEWQRISEGQREFLIRRVDARFKRLYSQQGWEYQEIRE